MKKIQYSAIVGLLQSMPEQFLHTIEHLIAAFLQLHLLSLHLPLVQLQLIISASFSGIGWHSVYLGLNTSFFKCQPQSVGFR